MKKEGNPHPPGPPSLFEVPVHGRRGPGGERRAARLHDGRAGDATLRAELGDGEGVGAAPRGASAAAAERGSRLQNRRPRQLICPCLPLRADKYLSTGEKMQSGERTPMAPD